MSDDPSGLSTSSFADASELWANFYEQSAASSTMVQAANTPNSPISIKDDHIRYSQLPPRSRGPVKAERNPNGVHQIQHAGAQFDQSQYGLAQDAANFSPAAATSNHAYAAVPVAAAAAYNQAHWPPADASHYFDPSSPILQASPTTFLPQDPGSHGFAAAVHPAQYHQQQAPHFQHRTHPHRQSFAGQRPFTLGTTKPPPGRAPVPQLTVTAPQQAYVAATYPPLYLQRAHSSPGLVSQTDFHGSDMAEGHNLPSPHSAPSPHSENMKYEAETPTPAAAAEYGPFAGNEADARSASTPTAHDGSPAREPQERRAVEPPRNADGKICCDWAKCAGVTFERRCEWSKHYDKHVRPYKCTEPECDKLAGFTYAGGLIRHQREVHKQHGGPKELLNCPVPLCKRGQGHGFTRKENLMEHVRRVHRTTLEPGAHGDFVLPESAAAQLAAAETDEEAAQASSVRGLLTSAVGARRGGGSNHSNHGGSNGSNHGGSNHGGGGGSPVAKSRKRTASATVRDGILTDEGDEEAGDAAEMERLREENERLRTLLMQKNARIDGLEAEVQMLQAQLGQTQMQ